MINFQTMKGKRESSVVALKKFGDEKKDNYPFIVINSGILFAIGSTHRRNDVLLILRF
jgi:hypothetical protein